MFQWRFGLVPAVCLLGGATIGASIIFAFPVRDAYLDAQLYQDEAVGQDGLRPGLERQSHQRLVAAHDFAAWSGAYDAATGVDEPAEIETHILALLDQAPEGVGSPDVRLMFVRLFEIDPHHALGLAQTIDLAYTERAAIFRSWADVDSHTAFELLREINDPWIERQYAIALLDHARNDLDFIDQLLAQGRTLDKVGLQMAAIRAWAATDPASAIAELQRIDSVDDRALAVTLIARAAALRDPHLALDQFAPLIDPALQQPFMAELYGQWASMDLSGFLRHLESLDPDRPGIESLVTIALTNGVEADPIRALEFSRTVGGRLGFVAATVALDALAAQNPGLALQELEAMTAGGRDRNRLVASFAAGYARSDPDAALAFVAALDPPVESARHAVMTAIVSADLEHAVQIELDRPVMPGFREPPPAWLVVPAVSDLADPYRVADRILDAVRAEGLSMRTDMMMTAVLSRWSVQDPYGAIGWIQSLGSSLPPNLVSRVARQVSETLDLDEAILFADLLGPDMRDGWIESAISAAATYDPARAMSVADRYSDRGFHESAVFGVVLNVAARHGPQAAAELIGSSPTAVGAARFIGSQWAQSDPAAAARWAAGLTDAEVQGSVVDSILDEWMVRDIDEASRWAHSLPDPVLRSYSADRICRQRQEAVYCD